MLGDGYEQPFALVGQKVPILWAHVLDLSQHDQDTIVCAKPIGGAGANVSEQ
jgi:hypothetical protein